MQSKPQCLLCNSCKSVERVFKHFFNGNVYYCNNCKFGYVWPIVDEKFLENYYTHDYKQKSDEKFSYFYKLKRYKYAWSQYKFISDYLPERNLKNISILDIGCNFGALLEYFHDAGVEAYGTEISLRAFQNAKNEFKDRIQHTFNFYEAYK